jgi:hypothetical protein
MTAPGKPEVTEGQIRAWRDSGHPYKLIAAAVAEWAAGKERGTVLPDDGFFGIEASGRTYQRARVFLAAQGVLEASGGPALCRVIRTARNVPGKAHPPP